MSNDLPWAPVADGLLPRQESDPAPMPEEKRLAVVTSSPKTNRAAVAEIDPSKVVRTPVSSRLERPLRMQKGADELPWYPQIEEMVFLRLVDGFIGDNVVFDEADYFGMGRWWLGNRKDSWKLYSQTTEVRHVDFGVSIGAWGGEAFQLFILDALPKLAAVIDLFDDPRFVDLKVVSHGERSKVARWFWKRLGLEKRVVQKPIDSEAGFVVHADVALAIHHEPNLGRYGMHPRGCMTPVRRRLGAFDPGPQDTVLYLRRPSHRIRSVDDEEVLLLRLEQMLAGTPYRLDVFESSGDIEADSLRVHRAKLILGPHGGAMANMIFAQPGTHVLEFLPIYELLARGEDPRPSYWGLAQACDLTYWTTRPRRFGFNHQAMRLKFDEILRIAQRVLRQEGAPAVRIPERNRVFLAGNGGYRAPLTFDWVRRPQAANCEPAVMVGNQILNQIDRPGRKIGWIRESPSIATYLGTTGRVLHELDKIEESYEVVLTSDRGLCEVSPVFDYNPAGANMPFPWVSPRDYRLARKSKLCSMLASKKLMVDGHVERHRRAFHLKDRLDLYGGAWGSPRVGEVALPNPGSVMGDKSAGLVPYCFSVTMENCRCDLYYTEKLTDCFAVGTVPIYWGSRAIGEIFDLDGVIFLEDDFDPESLSFDLYREMLPAVRNNLEILRGLESSADRLFRKFIDR